MIGLLSITAMAQTPQPMPPLDVYGNLWVQDSIKAANGVYVDSSGMWVPLVNTPQLWTSTGDTATASIQSNVSIGGVFSVGWIVDTLLGQTQEFEGIANRILKNNIIYYQSLGSVNSDGVGYFAGNISLSDFSTRFISIDSTAIIILADNPASPNPQSITASNDGLDIRSDKYVVGSDSVYVFSDNYSVFSKSYDVNVAGAWVIRDSTLAQIGGAADSNLYMQVQGVGSSINLIRGDRENDGYAYSALPRDKGTVNDVLLVVHDSANYLTTAWRSLPNHFATAAFGDSSLTLNLINGLPIWVTNATQNLWSQDTIFHGFSYTNDFFTCQAPGTYLPSGMVTVTNNEVFDLMIGAYVTVNGSLVGPAINMAWIANATRSSIQIPNYPAVLSEGDVVQVLIIPLNADADVTVSSGIITLNQIR